jgi:hypothetical protein
VDWIYVAQYKDQGHAFANIVTNPLIHKILDITWMAGQLTDSQEDLCSMVLGRFIRSL